MHARTAVMSLLLVLLGVPAHAITLDELRRSLAEFHGEAPMRIRIDSTDRRGEGKEKVESRGASVAEDDGTSIRLVHDKKELRQQLAKKTSNNRADHSVPATEVFEFMNYAPSLLKTLEGATLKKATPTTLDGNPATLLEIIPVREKDEDGDKWIKGYNDTLLLWLGPGNVPLAAERTTKIKARIVVIGVEFNKKEKYRFTRSGERLLVAARSVESSSSGLGKSESQFKTAMVSVLR
jgi:hypothetical protein